MLFSSINVFPEAGINNVAELVLRERVLRWVCDHSADVVMES